MDVKDGDIQSLFLLHADMLAELFFMLRPSEHHITGASELRIPADPVSEVMKHFPAVESHLDEFRKAVVAPYDGC
jgi:hypothetical protein